MSFNALKLISLMLQVSVYSPASGLSYQAWFCIRHNPQQPLRNVPWGGVFRPPTVVHSESSRSVWGGK